MRASRVSRTSFGGTFSERCTPCVVCTVNAVLHETPYRPRAAIVLRSAVIPAPEDGSKPAMAKTTFGDSFGIIYNLLRNRGLDRILKTRAADNQQSVVLPLNSCASTPNQALISAHN